ncbi:MAG: hypothetical protein AAF330_00375 [Pseudomonadota bacterium]
MASSLEVSRYYIDVSAKYFAVNVTATGIYREEALNEIRNAFAHVVRADLVDGDGKKAVEQRSREYDKALGHLQRVALDSAKDTIFYFRQRCEGAISIVEKGDVVLPGSIHAGLADLITQRAELTEIETANPPNLALVERYGDLMGRFYNFFKRLDEEFTPDLVAARKAAYEEKQRELEEARERKADAREHRAVQLGWVKTLVGAILGAILGLALSQSHSAANDGAGRASEEPLQVPHSGNNG